MSLHLNSFKNPIQPQDKVPTDFKNRLLNVKAQAYAYARTTLLTSSACACCQSGQLCGVLTSTKSLSNHANSRPSIKLARGSEPSQLARQQCYWLRETFGQQHLLLVLDARSSSYALHGLVDQPCCSALSHDGRANGSTAWSIGHAHVLMCMSLGFQHVAPMQ